MEDVKEFVIDYIQKEYTVPKDIDILTLDYVESGYIDSLGLIQFIATLEDEFNVTFTNEEMENPYIKVVGNLISMIESKMEV